MYLHCEACFMFSFGLLWKLLNQSYKLTELMAKENMRVILCILLIQIHYFQNNPHIVEQCLWLKLKILHDVTHNLDTIA